MSAIVTETVEVDGHEPAQILIAGEASKLAALGVPLGTVAVLGFEVLLTLIVTVVYAGGSHVIKLQSHVAA